MTRVSSCRRMAADDGLKQQLHEKISCFVLRTDHFSSSSSNAGNWNSSVWVQDKVTSISTLDTVYDIHSSYH